MKSVNMSDLSLRVYNTHLIYNTDLNKYWKSGKGWVDAPDQASRFRYGSDAEFVKDLFVNPHAGEPDLNEKNVEVHTFRVYRRGSDILEKI